MALHIDLPIYKLAYELLDLATDLTRNLPRDFKASIGGHIRVECVAMIVAIGKANVAVLHEQRDALVAAHADLEAWLPEQLHCRLNPRKTVLQPVERGIDFVGHVIKPWSRSVRDRTVRAALRRIETMPAADVHEVGNSYFGLFRQSPQSHTDRARLGNALRKRGHSINRGLTKAYRSTRG